MDFTGICIGITVVTFIAACVFLWIKWKNSIDAKRERERLHAEQKERIRQRIFSKLKSVLSNIEAAQKRFNRLLHADSGYFSNFQLVRWEKGCSALYKLLVNLPHESVGLSHSEVTQIDQFVADYEARNHLRTISNQQLLKHDKDKYAPFFENIEGCSLDDQQRTAIITDEDNNLIIAGAGSGKTTTIVGKVQYLLNRYNIEPDQILLISYTRKAVDQLVSRVGVDGLHAKTFHKLGKDIIAEVEGVQPAQYGDAQFKSFIRNKFEQECKDSSFLSLTVEFFSDYFKAPATAFDFKTQGEQIQYLKDSNWRPFKLKEENRNGRATYRREIVKSVEECKIANFFLFNGVKYEYESHYEHRTADRDYAQYKPDFTVWNSEGERVYIEHFGIDKNGNVPRWFANEGETYEWANSRYSEGIKWKRELHKEHGTVLIESYSYEFADDTIFQNLKQNLEEAGVVITPKTEAEKWELIQKGATDEIDEVLSLFGTFITLMKSNNHSIESLISSVQKDGESFWKSRRLKFLDILSPLFQSYQNHLTQRNEIDFNDLINQASHYVKQGKYKPNYRYIIIDEFQDISISRYELINNIKNAYPSCRTFCVGDDWQSIFRFAGNDIALFKDFEEYFGVTERLKIETTYRFNEPLVSFSSQFILKNPNQSLKLIRGSNKQQKTEYKLCYSDSEDLSDVEVVEQIFKEIAKESSIDQQEIMILGRYGNNRKRLEGSTKYTLTNDSITYSFQEDSGVRKQLKANFSTIHKSKGLEADYIIVINCNSGKYGFPSEISDDEVLNMLLSRADQFENGEERRLFYVAMTRAKKKVYLVSKRHCKSKFINEVESEDVETTEKKCPRCLTADVVLRKTGFTRNGNGFRFYGCVNYAYGCEYNHTEFDD